ncbi:MAG: 3-dehydroquinate synthase [Clostridia bacterium]|nr:3-dehydroquinate synthase [Clostridia bacterium]
MKDITIKTSATESVIHCGQGTFDLYAPKLKEKQFFVVTDSNVFAIYRHLMWQTFGGDFPVKIIPAGEKSKTYKYLVEILKEMLKAGMRRNCTVVAFGGGVVGDIAGLAAALYMRGVHLTQIPTTLLAQVDSSVGGKTAVDMDGVKNVIGTFYQPEEVIVDPRFLKTLPEREMRCGLGEIIKYGGLDENIFNKLVANKNNLKDFNFLEDITYDCVNHKAKVVTEDERETTGLRKTLNLGHSTGHALELYYRKKSHGEFVLIGMYYELYIAEKSGICGGQYAKDLKNLILSVIKKPPYYEDIEKAAAFAKFDKKNDDDNIILIVPKSLGQSAELKLSLENYVSLLKECV